MNYTNRNFYQASSVLQILYVLIILLVILTGCQPLKALGKNPSGEDLKKIEALPNYKNGEFQNIENIPQTTRVVDNSSGTPKVFRLLKFFGSQPKELLPSKPIAAVDTDLKNTTFNNPTVVWFGHSSFLLKTTTANILFDPNFSGFAGPLRGSILAFEGSNVYSVSDMPEIDALVISHDHYDHLDYRTVKKLRKKVKKIIVPMGVGSHLRFWGFDPKMVIEVNWNDSVRINDNVIIIATPAHHRSNRTLETRKTLWASYVVQADDHKIYFSGDTGYSKHFKLIGEQHGPFDLAMLECGQYNVKWPQSHMFPHQIAQAAVDLKTEMVIPVHWGKFAQSDHAWNESVRLFIKAADSLNVPVSVPFIGQPYTIGTKIERIDWWNFF